MTSSLHLIYTLFWKYQVTFLLNETFESEQADGQGREEVAGFA